LPTQDEDVDDDIHDNHDGSQNQLKVARQLGRVHERDDVLLDETRRVARAMEELIGEEVRQRRRWNVFLLSIMLMLLTTTGFALWNAYRAAQQTSIAEQKTRDAVTAANQVEQQRNIADQQRQLAERQADIAQANAIRPGRPPWRSG
jgi:hypothetical protein